MAAGETNASHGEQLQQLSQRSITTATTAASSPFQPAPAEGRAGRAARRRPRAPRRSPTTVLDTDATNFRAMVQQFTGVPLAPFDSGHPHVAAPGVGRGGAPGLLPRQPAAFPFGVRRQLLQHDQRRLFAPGAGGRSSAAAGAGGDDAVLLEGSGGGPQRGDVEVLEQESLSSSQIMTRSAAPTGFSDMDGFLF